MTGFDDDLKQHLHDTGGDAPGFDAVLARVARRRSRRRAVGVVASGLVVGALVATAVVLGRPDDPSTVVDPGPSGTRGTTAPTASPSGVTDPAAVLEADLPSGTDPFHWGDEIFHFLAEDGEIVDESPWTACMSGPPDDEGVSQGGCWDGSPELGGVSEVGAPEALWFSFDYPGWTFEDVTFRPRSGDVCGRAMSVQAVRVSERIFRIDPSGPAGTYQVDVFGRGAEGGDAVTSVLWTTRTSAAAPAPRATGSLFTDEDGRRVAPYGGPELHLAGMADTTGEASAEWTVTDAEGHAVTLPLRRLTQRCQGEGNLSFSGRELTSAELASLTGERVTYTVTVTLDGVEHVGTAVWPDDENDEAPYVDLTFDPPLPRYAG